MNKTVFLLLRHGQSIANLNHILAGHTNVDLSELGFEQARCAAEYLKDTHIDFIYSSDLIRAYHTALPHAVMRGMPIILSESLREIYLGEWDGLAKKDLMRDCPEEYNEKWLKHFSTYEPPKGEAVPKLARRIYNALAEIGKKHPGKTVLIGTHAAAIRSFYGLISDIPEEEAGSVYPFPDNASVTIVQFDGEKFTPVDFSVSGHLTLTSSQC